MDRLEGIKMIKYENDCVGCPPHMGCLGDACPNRNVPYYFCDKCGQDTDPDDLHDVEGEMICRDCLFKMFPKISVGM